MALDYNKLMEELGNCLGLEGSATESISNKGKIKKAFEGYDEVEQELAESLGEPVLEKVSDQDLVFDEDSEQATDPEEIESDPVQEDDSEEEVPEGELFKESVKSYLNKLLEDKSLEEAKEFIGNLFGEALSEVCPEEENDSDTEVTEDSGEEDETLPEEEVEEGEEPEISEAEEGEEDPEAAFESLQAKMIDRYKTLCRKKNNKNSSATEGTGQKSKAVLDENAIARTSVEFGYSGNNLRKIVTEAIEKGVI